MKPKQTIREVHAESIYSTKKRKQKHLIKIIKEIALPNGYEPEIIN